MGYFPRSFNFSNILYVKTLDISSFFSVYPLHLYLSFGCVNHPLLDTVSSLLYCSHNNRERGCLTNVLSPDFIDRVKGCFLELEPYFYFEDGLV